ncbi:MAG TPA: cytochrome c biogenesis protein CcdA [Rectinemataceae bacterium]|nr:cytochrome c biogenesis protein CcdA [Rectinemataceae bacterium]
MSDPGILPALGAGLLTFLSPCVLPLIPGYLSFISGYSLAEIREGRLRFRVLGRTAVFIAGFTIVFVAMGLVFAGGGLLLGGLSRAFTIGAGALIALLGLNLIFDFLKFLDLEARFHAKSRPSGYAGAFLVGIAFAAGWSPCVGPILAAILVLAARDSNAGRAALLLGSYSLGLALPFLAAGLFFDRTKALMDGFRRHARLVRVGSGSLLVALGLAMAFGKLGLLSGVAPRLGMALAESLVSNPTPLRIGVASAWALLAALTMGLPLLRGRRVLTAPRIVSSGLFAALAAGELAGLWSLARLISQWLLFRGA